MSPEAQLLFTGAVELVIGLTLAWCAYRVWKRHSVGSAATVPDVNASDDGRQRHVDLLKEVDRLVGEHTQSVEFFQNSINCAHSQAVETAAGCSDVSSQVQIMRAANQHLGKNAESKSVELTEAVVQNPAAFQDVSMTFSDHRQKTTTFESALSLVHPGGTAGQIQKLTFESLLGVLETKKKLECELSAAHKQIEQQAARLRAAEHDARVDLLTRIPNRRAFDEHINGVHCLFERQGIAYSIVVLDLDNFKLLNDTYGHAAGDAVLQVTGKLLQSQLRLSDRAFRIGGEEFVIVLVATDLRPAKIVAERARKRIEASVVYFEGRELRVTASVGVADARKGLSSHDVLEQADSAMYSAKDGGRNRIEVARRESVRDDARVDDPIARNVGLSLSLGHDGKVCFSRDSRCAPGTQ